MIYRMCTAMKIPAQTVDCLPAAASEGEGEDQSTRMGLTRLRLLRNGWDSAAGDGLPSRTPEGYINANDETVVQMAARGISEIENFLAERDPALVTT